MGQTDLKVYTAILKGKQPGNKGLYLSSWIVKTDPRIYNPAEIMEVQFFYSLAYCIFEVNTKIEGGHEHQTAALLILLLTSEVQIDQLETESSNKLLSSIFFLYTFLLPHKCSYCTFEVNTKIEGGDEHKKLQHC